MRNGRLIFFLLVALVWLVACFSFLDSRADPDITFPMANQRIEWNYANKNP